MSARPVSVAFVEDCIANTKESIFVILNKAMLL